VNEEKTIIFTALNENDAFFFICQEREYEIRKAIPQWIVIVAEVACVLLLIVIVASLIMWAVC